MPSIRLYIFISFIFFLVIALLSNSFISRLQRKSESNQGKGYYGIHIEGLSNQDLAKVSELELTDERLDSIIMSTNKKPNWLNKHLVRSAISMYSGDFTISDYAQKIFKVTSLIMFILMPIFALYLLMLNYKKKLYYVEHLTFSLHFHSLLFILLLIYGITTKLLPSSFIVIPFVILGILVYLLLSLRNAYSLSWGKALLKTVLLSVIYLVTILVFLFISLFAALI